MLTPKKKITAPKTDSTFVSKEMDKGYKKISNTPKKQMNPDNVRKIGEAMRRAAEVASKIGTPPPTDRTMSSKSTMDTYKKVKSTYLKNR